MDVVTKDLISGDKGKLAGSGLGNGLFVGPGLRERRGFTSSFTSGNVSWRLGQCEAHHRIIDESEKPTSR